MYQIKILYFAQLKEELDLAEETYEGATPLDGQDLIDLLSERYPLIKTLGPSLSLAVNEEYHPLEEPIPGGATVALIPPVSGG